MSTTSPNEFAKMLVDRRLDRFGSLGGFLGANLDTSFSTDFDDLVEKILLRMGHERGDEELAPKSFIDLRQHCAEKFERVLRGLQTASAEAGFLVGLELGRRIGTPS